MSENEERDWQQELKEKDPKLLKNCYACVGEGWETLMDNMLGRIQHYMKWRWENEYQENRVVIESGEVPPEDKESIQQPEFSQIHAQRIKN